LILKNDSFFAVKLQLRIYNVHRENMSARSISAWLGLSILRATAKPLQNGRLTFSASLATMIAPNLKIKTHRARAAATKSILYFFW
jgi:hypothetical protein